MTDYSVKFQGSAAVERYKAKLSNRIDLLREVLESEVLLRHARGALFDCTIGVGRLIGKLQRVTSYGGMDLSTEFVDYVVQVHPGTKAQTGDLIAGIGEPDASYDTTICLRSLSAIGHVPEILADMVRITRPGGIVIFDYGRKPTQTTINGQSVWIDDAPIDKIIAALPVRVVERVRLDGVLTRLKKNPRVYRALIGGPGRIVPDAALAGVERLLAPMMWEREVIVLETLSPQATAT